MRRYKAAILVLVFLSGLSGCGGTEKLKNTDPENDLQGSNNTEPVYDLPTAVQVLEILEKSKLKYNVSIFADDDGGNEPAVLSNMLYRTQRDSTFHLGKFQLSDSAVAVFNHAENAFMTEEFDQALRRYRHLLKLEPSFTLGQTMIGDVFFRTAEYDSAAWYFRKSIKENEIDYTAHWFLGDTYQKQGHVEAAGEWLTRAHLLNKYNPRLLGALKNYREKTGHPWVDWDFVPRYQLSQKGHEISVSLDMDWMAYAVTKALWKYEPGYAESKTGRPQSDDVLSIKEEAEAVAAWLSGKDPAKDKKAARIHKIIEAGYFQEFFYYEIAATKSPYILLMLSEIQFERLINYVNRFH